MRRRLMLLCVGLAAGIGTASATPLAPSPHSDAMLIRVAGACFGGRAIPTEAHPLVDEKRIAKMRAAGQLPDTFVCGRCTYNLGGDPGAAWYAKTCK